jgi:hypothetical protein
MENKKNMLSPNIEQYEKDKVSRRGFLKKAVWSAPGLIALGQLAKPVSVHGIAPAGTPSDEGETDGWNPLQ